MVDFNQMKRIISCLVLNGLFKILLAQDIDFVISQDVCQEQQVDISNASTWEGSFIWDFCGEEFIEQPDEEFLGSLTNVTRVRGSKLVYDTLNDQYYYFITDDSKSLLHRLSLGDELGVTFGQQQLTLDGDPLNSPHDIEIIQNEDGNWFGYVGSATGVVGITRLEFGSSLANNTLTSTNLGTFDEGNVQLRDVKIWKENGNFYLVTVSLNTNRFIIINYGSSLLNTPIDTIKTSTIAGINQPNGFDLIWVNGDIISLVVGLDSRNIIKVNFGTSIENSFSVENTYDDSDFPSLIDRLSRVKLINNFGRYYAIVNQFDAGFNTLVLDFDYFSNSFTPIDLEHTISQYNDSGGGYSNGDYFFYSVTSDDVYRISFTSDCGESMKYSTDKTPHVFYTIESNPVVSLSTNNLSETKSDTISVSSNIAPSISHTSDYICETSPVTFSPSNPGLSSYSWDFDGDGSYEITDDNTGSDQSFDYSGLGPGTYTVRLDVNDGTCDNFYEEEITIYSNPPIPAFTVVANECVNTDISFTNDTDESQHTGVIAYMWDFDNDGIIDSTDPDPTFAYSTPGTKTVVLYDTIPGCSNVSATFDIDISSGPIAGYAPSTLSACEGETIAFTDTSSVDSQDYFWDFQNGFTSTISNPAAQLYENSGSYFVSLTTTDAQGCEDNFVQEISISASPQISIDFDIPCTSPDGVQFFDLTTVDGADIVSWSWEVDGEEVSTQQNPTLNFSSTGVKTVGLTVQSSNGCEQYVTEDIEVLAAPSPDFSIDLGCQGETTSFTDETESVGNPIVSWLWTVDGVNYGTQDINHVFTNPGTFDVMLEVTGQNFCSETITKTVEIIELPQVNFTVNGECDNQVISAQDQSTGSVDPVISRRWMLDGVNVGNGSQLLLSELEDNTYELELELETESGCLVSSSQILEINEAPEAEFTSSRTYGIPGDRLTFTNNSSGGVSYQWLLDGELRSANSGAESIEFSTPGTYDVSLVAQNSLGCNDTTTREILIAIPEVDLAIGSFELVEESDVGKIFLEVENRSNLPVEITEAQIVLENQFRVSEQILEFIGVGETSLVSLNAGIPLNISEPSYFCVKLISQYEELEYLDINPINNEKCITLQPDVQVENPFPNPVRDQFRLKVVTPADGQVSLRLINATGKLQREETCQASAGLNNFFIDMSTLNPGIYFVTVNVLGNTFKRKVVKL